ncbi:hypothetical protein V6N12_028224 [Hibiscus sabdariffa]|uniref:Uncharacterized protein n=1 Tax=Hibiscus sabdariffa TaxID=183260 RepID=A0ABR2F572_9ROSI
MEELRSAMEEHMGLMADLVQKLSSELRSGIRPAYDNFVGFFHAIDWKVRLLSFPSLCFFYFLIGSREIRGTMVDFLTGIPSCLVDNNNLLQEEYQLPDVSVPSRITILIRVDFLIGALVGASSHYRHPHLDKHSVLHVLPNSPLEKSRTQTPCKAFPQQAGLKLPGAALLPSPSSIACAFINCKKEN